MSEIKKYYASSDKQTFYQKYWGGESIHVGIYQDTFNDSDSELSLSDFIHRASRFKSNVMSNLIIVLFVPKILNFLYIKDISNQFKENIDYKI